MTIRTEPMTPAVQSLASHRGWSCFTPARHVTVVPFVSVRSASELEWARHVAAARSTWNRLTEQELLRSNGQIKLLAALIRDRYMLSRAEADQQVRRFLREQTL